MLPANLNKQTTIYLGAMTGTSVDKEVDFTAAIFDDNGKLLHHQNATVILPEAVRNILYHLSTTPCDQLTVAERSKGEIAVTDFMIDAYCQVITEIGLQNHPKNKLVLSPHGQTIDHQPQRQHTDQLLHGERLAVTTGYPVVFRHRQACITVSDAAPLAPVLLQTLFPPLIGNDDRELHPITGLNLDTAIVNGGGIANICVFSEGKTIAFDTGPANGPLDELVKYILATDKSAIPADLQTAISAAGYDVDGAWAARGQIDRTMYRNLMGHRYFAQQTTRKSADRTWFNLDWVLQARNHTMWADCLTTLSTVIADSIAQAITANLKSNSLQLGFYGGLRYNQTVMQRINQQLQSYRIHNLDWHAYHLNPDFIESLLMAYLGFCVHHHRPVDLSYCTTTSSLRAPSKTIPNQANSANKLQNAPGDGEHSALVIPGLLVNPISKP